MWNVDKLLQKKIEHDTTGFGYELGDGCACFIDKLISGEWKICKLDSKDNAIFFRILPGNIGNIEFKKVLAEMLDAK